MENQPLITKYRPAAFEEVLGNEKVVAALQAAVASNSCPHAFLLTGVSGLGKTTLARIIAKAVQASVLEIDAATNSGVDQVRALVEASGFQPVTKEDNRMYILDECHALSKAAWQALLKLIEEPPSYLYIALCTTESAKVPETIKTRCYPVSLKPLRPNEISDLVEVVAETEQWPLTDDTFNAIVQAATGQPRKALSILQAGHGAQTREELAEIITQVETENSPVIELVTYLMKGGTNWRQIQKLLTDIQDDEETITIASRYLIGTMLRSEEEQARNLWVILEALNKPKTSWDKKVNLVCAIGESLWGRQMF